MTGHHELRPEAMPLCGPADTIELIGSAHGTGHHAERREWVYVAVHRGHGLWTHVYDVVHHPGPFGEEIRLIRVLPGDRRDEARSWALAAKGKRLAGTAGHGKFAGTAGYGKFAGTAERDGAMAMAGSAVDTTRESKCLLPAAP
jgi:hypothetical protein